MSKKYFFTPRTKRNRVGFFTMFRMTCVGTFVVFVILHARNPDTHFDTGICIPKSRDNQQNQPSNIRCVGSENTVVGCDVIVITHCDMVVLSKSG